MGSLYWLFFLIPGVAIVLFAIKKCMDGGTCRLSTNMQGKVVIITGSNCGIGYIAASRLAQLGAKVVMACRDANRANTALEKIKKAVNGAQVEFIKIELTNPSSITEFVNVFKSKYDRLDVLINNAGLVSETRVLTSEGVEKTFSANHLGHFMLTLLLKDHLVNSAPSRVINISSRASLKATINWDDLMLEKGYEVMRAYSQSKLANVIFSSEFNRRFESKGVKAVSVHPGVVRTEIWRPAFKKISTTILIIILYPLILLLVKNCKQGTQTTLQCSLVDHGKLKGGAYYADCVPAKMNRDGNNEEFGKRLWDRSLELLKMKEIA